MWIWNGCQFFTGSHGWDAKLIVLKSTFKRDDEHNTESVAPPKEGRWPTRARSSASTSWCRWITWASVNNNSSQHRSERDCSIWRRTRKAPQRGSWTRMLRWKWPRGAVYATQLPSFMCLYARIGRITIPLLWEAASHDLRQRYNAKCNAMLDIELLNWMKMCSHRMLWVRNLFFYKSTAQFWRL